MKEHVNKRRNKKFSHEIKLFTDKREMIEFVNQLTHVENVEIFKIEDQLYKVHVIRKLKDHDCCQNHDKEEHECCQNHENDVHECCQNPENEEHECCQEEKKQHRHHGCCKDQD